MISAPVANAHSPKPGNAWILVLFLAGIVYVICLAPGPVWQDNGLIQCRVLRRDLFGQLGLALSHPLYYVIAIAFQALPFGESAYRTNLVSAVFGAITVANIFLLLLKMTGRQTSAIAGALSVGVAHTFWQHAALPETYTLAAALLSTELLIVLQYCRTERAAWLILLFFVNGLGISNHLLALLSLICYLVIMVYLTFRRRIGALIWLAAIGAWFCGASLYLVLIAITLAHGSGLAETIASALFGGYARNVLNVHVGMHDLFNCVLHLGLNFPTPTAILALLGMITWRAKQFKILRTTLLALFFIHLAYVMRYNIPDQYTFFIPSIVLVGVWIGLGVDVLLWNKKSRVLRAAILLFCALPSLIYIPLPQLARAWHLNVGISREVPYRDAYAYFLQPWKTGYRGAEQFATELRDQLSPGAVLLADGTTVRPIHYLQLTGRWKNEIKVFPPPVMNDRASAMPGESDLESKIAAGQVYVVSPVRLYCPSWLLDHYTFAKDGLVYRVLAKKTDYVRTQTGMSEYD